MHAGLTEAALSHSPNETVAMDIVGPFPRSHKGNCWLLTMIDTFTRWPVAVPIPNKESATIANAIYRHWICEKSVPMKIVSDQAREFISKGMNQLAARMGTTLVTTSGYNPTGNSSVERFHRYLGAALTTIYDKVTLNWDDLVPAVLFSYRASVCESTGYSPFFMETGREPSLPMTNMFPYLREKEKTYEAFVTDIVGNLEAAFEKAKLCQAVASEKNKARQPAQYEPDFKAGDYLLYYKRTAKEGRVEESKDVSLPRKLQNPFAGPFKMLRWTGPRAVALEIAGKEFIVNVNRVIKHHVWDDVHMTTSETKTTQRPPDEEALQADEIIVFPMGVNSEQAAPFGIGRIMEIRGPNNILIQWWGNADNARAGGTFRPGWVDIKTKGSYYSDTRGATGNRAWTSDDTATTVSSREIVLRGTKETLFNAAGYIRERVRAQIDEGIGEPIEWA